MTNSSSPVLSSAGRAFAVAALVGVGIFSSGCGAPVPACSTTCAAIAGSWTFNTTNVTTSGSCAWANANGPLTVTQTGSQVTLSLPVLVVFGVTSLTQTVNANGTLFSNSTVSASAPQSSENVNTTTITKSDNFQLQFTAATAAGDAGGGSGGVFAGSWTTSQQQTTGTSAPAVCTRTATVSGTSN